MKKLVIFVGILSLFIAVSVANAKTIKIKNQHYINTVVMPWMQPVENLSILMSNSFSIPESSVWTMQNIKFGLYIPFYMKGKNKHKLPIEFNFENDQLTSVQTTYKPQFYLGLLDRIEEDYVSGGYVTNFKYIWHIYEREFEDSGYKVFIRIKYDISKKEPVIFKASCWPTDDRYFKEENKRYERPIKKYSRNIYSASADGLFDYNLLLNTYVNLKNRREG